MSTRIVTARAHDAPDGATHLVIICAKSEGGKCAHGRELKHAYFEVPVGADRDAFEAEAIAQTEKMLRRGELKRDV